MRLGGFFRPESLAELEASVDSLDVYGLSVIAAPRRIMEWSEADVVAYGERARELDIVITDSYSPDVNLLSRDPAERDRWIGLCRAMLLRSDAMHCVGHIITTGSPVVPGHATAIDRYDPRPESVPLTPATLSGRPDPYLITDECRAEFREVVLRIVDGLDLEVARLLIEPWHHSFFYRPEAIREFMESLDDPRVAFHLDQMNMMHQDVLFDTTRYINETFDLLAPYVGGVHFKDLGWDWRHLFFKLDEVLIGDGLMDYHTYVRRASELTGDIACLCEHRKEEGDYAINFARLHKIAHDLGVEFRRRGESVVAGSAGPPS